MKKKHSSYFSTNRKYSSQLASSPDNIKTRLGSSSYNIKTRLGSSPYPTTCTRIHQNLARLKILQSNSTKSFLWYVVNVIPKKCHDKIEAFLRLAHLHLKVYDDNEDDGQVGIWKTPLPHVMTQSCQNCVLLYINTQSWRK